MATSAVSKQLLLDRLNRVDRQTASLSTLKNKVQQAVAQVEAAIGGSATQDDRRVLEQLLANLTELQRSIDSMRSAVTRGREFASSV
ncbi:hypothetical protein [Cryptosporangium phraense]|uniref:Uncharacterized protein n=1 Tax=Cryptosporangium phraense TaxID=2593070 RepID=A0A545AJF1_9ACTN|nr:hypothetical protein [Cryptosporangium phraense]TQS41452.1 hypothetical protein FL583_29565 [Cryptosporangium phraense]